MLVHTTLACNSRMSGDRGVSGFAKNFNFETLCLGRRSFLTPCGKGHNVNLIGICVSTLDFWEVGWTMRIGGSAPEGSMSR